MAFTTTHLTALEDAIASGSLEVVYNGISTKYPSFEDLKKRYEFVKSQLVDAGQVSETRQRVSVASFSKD